MFTGIVQGKGTIIDKKTHNDDFVRYTVQLPDNLAHQLSVGASIANNGCCLTITDFSGSLVCFDVMRETLAKTNLGSLNVGDKVNIERAAKIGNEIGGHLMSGHIIAQTPIIQIDETEHNKTLWFRLPEHLKPYILEKGFIGLDGCSLTIGDIKNDSFCVHLIPETLQKTLFGERQVGDFINVEIDAQTQAIVETVHRVLQHHPRFAF